ncbi:MAG: prephenate dehydratase [Nitrosomonadales bacterium]|jgi:chorismate mutase/prephenate dehydratase|nr:prephenate dehydratase [Nitrosomonadales bacterium]MBT6015488.1 prephenate dehydratase [Nitrosomonadales bacterium]MBT6251185.1 prephenate dehydratase [Nitrosomonadales bacterium]MBT6602455.1 prephenate dehydratase [Nitrosomonadales bacterium]MBT6817722.1 prephenate dehydratase [Nitrosomonadales bacterium]
MTKKIDKLRKNIDEIDKRLLELISNRGMYAKEIGLLKDDGIVYKPEREAQVISKLIKENKGPLSNDSVTNIYKSIISNCRALEKKLTISFLGPSGTFSEEATIKHFGENVKSIPTNSIDEVFNNVQSSKVHYGVVPIENSTEGGISRTLDLLLMKDLKICGEITLPIHHCLISKSKDLKKIKSIYAHGQSLAQCHDWIANNLPNAEKITVLSNAEGAKIASKEKHSAAIASERAASIFKLNILQSHIEDEPNNTTRFLILSDQEIAPSGNDKTSIVVTTKNKPGAIVDLIQPFASRRVSLTKLESRPSKIGMWEYVFFIDVEGHKNNPKVKLSLADLEKKSSFMKFLGSYPKN